MQSKYYYIHHNHLQTAACLSSSKASRLRPRPVAESRLSGSLPGGGRWTARIYAVADIHGKPARIKRVHKVLLELNPDALIVAGDITNYFNSTDVVEQLNHMPVPVLAIREILIYQK